MSYSRLLSDLLIEEDIQIFLLTAVSTREPFIFSFDAAIVNPSRIVNPLRSSLAAAELRRSLGEERGNTFLRIRATCHFHDRFVSS